MEGFEYLELDTVIVDDVNGVYDGGGFYVRDVNYMWVSHS